MVCSLLVVGVCGVITFVVKRLTRGVRYDALVCQCCCVWPCGVFWYI